MHRSVPGYPCSFLMDRASGPLPKRRTLQCCIKQPTAEMCRFQISSCVPTFAYTQFQAFKCIDAAGSHWCERCSATSSTSTRNPTHRSTIRFGRWLVDRIFADIRAIVSETIYSKWLSELSRIWSSQPFGSVYGSAKPTSLLVIESRTISIALASNWRILIYQSMVPKTHLFAWWQPILHTNRLSALLNFTCTPYVGTSRAN